MRKLAVAGAVTVAVLLFLWFVWPTPWIYTEYTSQGRYGPDERVVNRVNRFTGQQQTASEDGWR